MIHFLAILFLNWFVIGIGVMAEKVVDDGIYFKKILFENTKSFGMIFWEFFEFLIDYDITKSE